jgi:hypothetical protein
VILLLPPPPAALTPREGRWFNAAVIANGAGVGGSLVGLLAHSLPCVLAGGAVWVVGWVALGVLLLVAATRGGRRRQLQLETRRRELIAQHEARLAELAELRRRLSLNDERGGRN